MKKVYYTTARIQQLGYQVFPLTIRKGDNHFTPKIKWKPLQNKKQSFPNLHPAAPIGIVCGIFHDLTVLDIDTTDTKLALEFATRLAKSNFKEPPPIQLTPSGGLHIFMRHIPNTKNRTKLPLVESENLPERFSPLQFDLRTHGGMVKATPTPNYGFHPDFPLTPKNMLPYASKRLSCTLQKLSTPSNSSSNSSPNKTNEHWQKILKETSKGSRNTNATKVAGLLLKYFPKEKHSLAFILYKAWNRQYVSPSLDDKELERTFKSILKNEC